MKRTETATTVAKETPQAPSVASDAASEKASNTGVSASTRAASTVSSIPEDIEVGQGANDAEMPDVSDPDAGFCPTDDQPYRRLRRHTIT